jgi:hypothetical protein
LKAPFAYFGAKSRIAAQVWERFGDVPNMVEPFCGSCAVLLARPDKHRWWERTETVNDADSLLANFWRAVSRDPDAVAHHADYPVSESDLHARHLWLVQHGKGITAERMMGDPDWFDAKIAGWWVWGTAIWIGAGWCAGNGPWVSVDGVLVRRDEAAGMGVNRQLPHVADAGVGINRQLPATNLAGACSREATGNLRGYMGAIRDRLRRVRICCGDWTRVTTEAVTTGHGLTGVFLDPPYAQAERHGRCYAVESDVSAAVRRWAIENGDNPLLRIALCDYGEAAEEMPGSWERMGWKAAGGYGSQGEGRGRENASRETVWYSPHCLKPNRVRQLEMELV